MAKIWPYKNWGIWFLAYRHCEGTGVMLSADVVGWLASVGLFNRIGLGVGWIYRKRRPTAPDFTVQFPPRRK